MNIKPMHHLWLIYSRYKLGLHRSNVLYPPCAAAELHMRLFVNFTVDEIQEMVDKANSGEIDPIYIDYVEVMYVAARVSVSHSEIDNLWRKWLYI